MRYNCCVKKGGDLMARILLIDDDDKYLKVIKDLLTLENYQVDDVNDAVVALDKFKENHYDLVITDLIMDVIDGLQLVSLIKRINDATPIIILTGYVGDEKEIAAFDLNVDDYIAKPVSFEILLKRINARLRGKRITNTLNELYSKKDNLMIDLKTRKVYQNEEAIKLTAKEYDILCFFLAHKNQIFSREEIINNVWHNNHINIDTRTIDAHIKKIRSKVNTSSISSIRGIGYEWFE